MAAHPFKIRTTVTMEVKRRLLFRGTLLSAIGGGILLLGGVFLPPSVLEWSGWVLFLVGIGLICAGLLPYRRLTRLETSPYELGSDNGVEWLLSRGGKPILGIPSEIIERVSFAQEKRSYGIALTLRQDATKKMTLYDRRYKLVRSRENGLFLAYFSRRSCEELQQYLS